MFESPTRQARRAVIRIGVVLLSATLVPSVAAATPDVETVAASPVLTALKQELKRSMEAFKNEPEPPYFLSYEAIQTQSARIDSAFGALTSSSEDLRRSLDIDLRVGDYGLDNTHDIRGSSQRRRRPRSVSLPIEDDPDAIASTVWFHTDQAYRRAVEDLTKIRTNIKVKVEEEDRSVDFSREEPNRYLGPVSSIDVDRSVWEKRLKRYTAPFASHGKIYDAQASLSATAETRWLVNSEGTELQTSKVLFRLSVSAFTKADDGMELPRYESFTAFSAEELPDDETVLVTVRRMIEDLQALRDAPVVDPYTGPAILSGRAAGVFFHEVFGHRIEGHRQKREEEGQTFKKMVGEQLLPEAFSILFDPTLRRLGDVDLAGHYLYDNEGVKARRVPIIERGVFGNFLMSRSPIEGFSKSNGHGRRQTGHRAVARQSNLLVEVEDSLTTEQLEQRLLELISAQDKPFGLIFDDIQGGFTLTGRTIPNAFNVLPILVYRIFPDGRRELVRGVDLIGTPLTAFSSIKLADDRPEVFNGTCGAESGGVPVSAVSPGILVEQIEVQKKSKSQERPPILPAPIEPETEPVENRSNR
jgi:predicted Zn-dependent protease